MSQSALCIYHSSCLDGFTAAWAVRKALGDCVSFCAAMHGHEPPDVLGRDVILVDFTYKRPVLEVMAQRAHSILILDHHKTAQEDLAGFPRQPDWNDWYRHLNNATQDRFEGVPTSVSVRFDMDHSGARMAWDFFNPTLAVPEFVHYVEDRDLWRFQLPNSRAVNAALFSYAYSFETWDLLEHADIAQLARDGQAIDRKHLKDVAELVKVMQRNMEIGGYVVPVANLPYTLASDAGHLMAEGKPFAACYWDTPTHRVFSLRSCPGGVDVAKIAEKYGGGGHKEAAGFQIAIYPTLDLGVRL